MALQGTGYDPGADVTFVDPMTDPLPYAPSLKMFCVYGVNKPVERCALRRPIMVLIRVWFQLGLKCSSAPDLRIHSGWLRSSS